MAPLMSNSSAGRMSGTMLRASVGSAAILLKDVSEKIKMRHASGDDGLELCQLRTQAVDQSVRAMWAAILEELSESDRNERETVHCFANRLSESPRSNEG